MLPVPDVRPLFEPLEQRYCAMLRAAGPADWQRATTSPRWQVQEVASHLLDGALRALSIQRDGFFGEAMPRISSYADLVNWLNQLNNNWVEATRRISPRVLVLLTEAVSRELVEFYANTNFKQKVPFEVAWAGEGANQSMALHLAREYTERWHHQLQIAQALNQADFWLDHTFFTPWLEASLQAVPNHFKEITRAADFTFSLVCDCTPNVYQISKQDERWIVERQSFSDWGNNTLKIEGSKLVRCWMHSKAHEEVEGAEVQCDKEFSRHLLGMKPVMV